jgi:uncharacterized protein YciI
MWYVIVGTDHADSSAARAGARAAHLERLRALLAEGRLLLAGPFPAVDADDSNAAGFSGSLIVAEFANLASARDWAQADPYVAAGVYRDVLVRPFRKALP